MLLNLRSVVLKQIVQYCGRNTGVSSPIAHSRVYALFADMQGPALSTAIQAYLSAAACVARLTLVEVMLCTYTCACTGISTLCPGDQRSAQLTVQVPSLEQFKAVGTLWTESEALPSHWFLPRP